MKPANTVSGDPSPARPWLIVLAASAGGIDAIREILAAFPLDLPAPVVLSGGGSDATDGVQTVKAHGGRVIAQDAATASNPGMPRAAVQSGAVDYVLPLSAIAPALEAIVRGQNIAVPA